ncbi:hypothetical protein PWT90_08768 [Aphanocladium album]|nr:hypothetical protein PWT90_08768 [Aphanocladium album]
MTTSFNTVLAILGVGAVAEPAEPSERCKRACKYIYYKHLSDIACAHLDKHEQDGTPLPAYLQGWSLEKLQDCVVKALAAFEEHGELTGEARLSVARPRRAAARGRRGAVPRDQARPAADQRHCRQDEDPVIGMLPRVFLEVTDEPAVDDDDAGEEEEEDGGNELVATTPKWVLGARYFMVGDGRYRYVWKLREDGSEWDLAMIPVEEFDSEAAVEGSAEE